MELGFVGLGKMGGNMVLRNTQIVFANEIVEAVMTKIHERR